MTDSLLTVRRTAPAHEVEYFLDCAQEQSDMDACTAMTLRLYGDDTAMMPLVTRRFENWRTRFGCCLELAEMANGILARLPEVRRAGLVHAGLRGIAHEIVQTAEIFSSWAIDDAVEGGAMEPFRDYVRSRNGIVFKRTMRQLRSPRFVRRYVKNHAGEADRLMLLADLMLRRAKELNGSAVLDRTISRDWRAQVNSIMIAERRRDRREAVTARKVILRSLRTAISVVGTETVSAFLRGEEIKLIGAESILAVQKRGRLTDRGHGCLSIGLADRNGARLANLCTFVENTPTLDQLSAFALWMASGEDKAILDAANVIGVAEAGHGHPLLSSKVATRLQGRRAAIEDLTAALGPEQATRIAEMIMGLDRARDRPLMRRKLTYEQWRARNDAYWRETQSHWIEAMMVLVIGYRNLPIFKATGVL